MDNLYENLENYEDENIVDELRRENGELKCKLEEYSDAIDKLQKEFDKVSSEYKQLEMNYSSLLKTSREEIERKAQIITRLNIEKDKMILNAIQNKRAPNLRRSRYMTMSKDRNSDVDPVKSNNENDKIKEASDYERKRQNHLSSEETTTTLSTDIGTYCNNKAMDRMRSTYQEAKENVIKDADNTSKPNPMSISSRRKSMPATRSEVKFSSDEEEDSYCTTTNRKYQNTNSNSKPQNTSKPIYEKNRLLDDRHRTTETSSIDDKYSSYHESNKEYRYRNSRYDSYRSRNKEKFDSQKYKRYYSPERPRRNTRNFSNDYYARQDYNRHRVLDSPPSDRYNNYQRRNREGKSWYEKDEYYDNDRTRNRHQENYSTKHKLHNDDEEPLSKRRRNDSIHNREEEKPWDTDRAPVQITGPIEDINHKYCQSPDDSTVQDTMITHPIREIKYTATTQLEDPRLLSKRYILHQGDKEMLTTSMGRNVNLKVIDTSNWDMMRVKIPQALTQKPSQCSEDTVRKMPMDIDNPLSNMSLESGEIDTYETDHLNIFEIEQSDQIQKGTENYQCSNAPFEKPPVKDLSKYTIPKVRREPDDNYVRPSKKQCKIKPLVKENNFSKDLITDNVSIKHSTSEDKVQSNGLSKKYQTNNSNEFSQTIQKNVLNIDKFTTKPLEETKKPSIEGDLELSDETSDNIDIQKEFIPENNITISKDISKTSEFKCSQTEMEGNSKVLNLESNCESIVNESVKTPRSKRKIQKKSKKEEAETVIERRTRSNKDNKAPKEIKEKFSELFGDTTTSLITPEDLGLPSIQAQSETLTKYIPICEDAQDAVLLKPIEAEINTTPKTKNNIIQMEHEDKCKPNKAYDDTKKKKSKKVVSSETIPNSNNEIESKPVHDVGENVNISYRFHENQPDTKEMAVTKEIQDFQTQKPNMLLKALATSTPQKEFIENPVVIVETTPKTDSELSSSKHDIVVSVHDDTAADQCSNNRTFDSQTELDAPDVRIFVKRRRKIMKKS